MISTSQRHALLARRGQPVGPAALDQLDELVVVRRQVPAERLLLVRRVDGDRADGLGRGVAPNEHGGGEARGERRPACEDGHGHGHGHGTRRRHAAAAQCGQYSTSPALRTRSVSVTSSSPDRPALRTACSRLDQDVDHVVAGGGLAGGARAACARAPGWRSTRVGADQDAGDRGLDGPRPASGNRARQRVQALAIGQVVLAPAPRARAPAPRTPFMRGDGRGDRAQLGDVGDRPVAQVDLRDPHVGVRRADQRLQRARMALGAAQAGEHRGVRDVVGRRRPTAAAGRARRRGRGPCSARRRGRRPAGDRRLARQQVADHPHELVARARPADSQPRSPRERRSCARAPRAGRRRARSRGSARARRRRARSRSSACATSGACRSRVVERRRVASRCGRGTCGLPPCRPLQQLVDEAEPSARPTAGRRRTGRRRAAWRRAGPRRSCRAPTVIACGANCTEQAAAGAAAADSRRAGRLEVAARARSAAVGPERRHRREAVDHRHVLEDQAHAVAAALAVAPHPTARASRSASARRVPSRTRLRTISADALCCASGFSVLQPKR